MITWLIAILVVLLILGVIFRGPLAVIPPMGWSGIVVAILVVVIVFYLLR
ncbi:hypothetical protein CPT_MarsHill_234 [Staphylococcus phage MarsHill]|nr:hypothetical protein CPT_MarsHill_234 [Staphylococcus phage MarsHill]QQO92884.1 hypothetical protein CPT_Madawaska_236 [Staphylococcus phage Madawaska]